MNLSRRGVIAGLSATTVAFAGLKMLSAMPAGAQPTVAGFGPLVPDPARLLDLPRIASGQERGARKLRL